MKVHHKRILFLGSIVLGAAFIGGVTVALAISPSNLLVRGAFLPGLLIGAFFPVTLPILVVSGALVLVGLKWKRAWGLSLAGILLVALCWLTAAWFASIMPLD